MINIATILADNLNEAIKDANVVTEEIDQSLPLPALIVQNIKATLIKELVIQKKAQYWLDALFHIVYIPEEGKTNQEEFYAVGQSLLFILEELTYEGGAIRATDISVDQGPDDTLTVIAQYRVRLRQDFEKLPFMKTLKQDFKTVKEEDHGRK